MQQCLAEEPCPGPGHVRFLRCPGSSARLALHSSFLRAFAALRRSAAAARAAFRPAGCKPHSNPCPQRGADVAGRNGDRGRGFPGRPGPFLRSVPCAAPPGAPLALAGAGRGGGGSGGGCGPGQVRAAGLRGAAGRGRAWAVRAGLGVGDVRWAGAGTEPAAIVLKRCRRAVWLSS